MATANASSVSKEMRNILLPSPALKELQYIAGPSKLRRTGEVFYEFDGRTWHYPEVFHNLNRSLYGDIYQLTLPSDEQLIYLNNTKDVEELLAKDEPLPEQTLLNIEGYKHDQKLNFLNLPEYSVQGRDWFDSQDWAFNELRKPAYTTMCIKEINANLDQVLAYIESKEGNVADVADLMLNYSIDTISSLLLGSRIGAVAGSTQAKIFKEDRHAFNTSLALKDMVPVEKASDPSLSFNQQIITSAADIQDLAESRLKAFLLAKEQNPKLRHSVVGQLAKRFGKGSHLITGLKEDFLSSISDPSGNSCTFLLHHIASNPFLQEELYEQIVDLVGDEIDEITQDELFTITILQGCIKETHRLNPTTLANGRRITEELGIAGFAIPAGQRVLFNNLKLARDSGVYPQPNRFNPFRWQVNLEKDKPYSYAVLNPVRSLPFSHGLRSSVGMKTYQLEQELLVVRLVRKYKMSVVGEPIDRKFMMVPGSNVNIKFTMRH